MKKINSIGIIGAACRLPGAPEEAAFINVLNQGLFTVGALPPGRWHSEFLYHPGQKSPGGAYIFDGGYLPSPYDFDIGVFGMSPREAMQVDPQQRLLAELVWEALENARIAPAAIAGKEVGVYIGVSALDHANLFGGDPGSIESHFMTGNTLSIVANRISYLFDLKGPSFVVDTACSSSLVAVDRAVADIRSGRVDMAIVGGVNMLMSPASFVGFSRAQMLSPTGACRPFSGRADGYVRSEGGVAFVLQREDLAAPGAVRARIAATAVNSDGRTSGIALPGLDGQRSLLERAYDGLSIRPDDLAFIEAHGTGTAVGDPIEATAIGTVLGKGRSNPLPIGSVKSNIGHLEPASGVAGMMKALIAMEQRCYPCTLHLDTLSPHIDFAKLNLVPAVQAVPLGQGDLACGVSSFGFGGTNAHVVMQSASAVPVAALPVAADALVVSSQCKESLVALAASYADLLGNGANPQRLAQAASTGRALMRQRAVVPMGEGKAMAQALLDLAQGAKPTQGAMRAITGTALPGPAIVCFVYNGNGAQWVGMGRQAYGANAAFRAGFDAADSAFAALGFESLCALLDSPDLEERLGFAAVAQPLIFAIQHGITRALAAKGLKPSMVLGHSVGEIAAAQAAGIISLEDATRILAARAHSQEAVHHAGTMAALAAAREVVSRLVTESGLPDLCVAADNGPASVTVSGSKDSIAAFMKLARKNRVAGRVLDIAYPYHSPLLDGIGTAFLAELGTIKSGKGVLPMFSAVTGALADGKAMDEAYWWQNIRHEVLFRGAVRAAAEHGANLFVEIGPRLILSGAVSGCIEAAGFTGRAIPSLVEGEVAHSRVDPVAETYARAIAHGFDPAGAGYVVPVDRGIALPVYPWQRKTYAYTPSSAALDLYGIAPRHPLIGARLVQGGSEWRHVLDVHLVPYLADHKVGGEVIMPATGLAEMALAVAREIWPTGAIGLEDFDIMQALILSEGEQREISVRYSDVASTVEIYARLRFSADEWTLYARGRITQAGSALSGAPDIANVTHAHDDHAEVYGKAVFSGIEYGPHFALLRSLRRQEEEVLEAKLALPEPGVGRFTRPQVLHPASLDASFHALFDYVTPGDPKTKTWLPIRFERLTVWQDGADIHAATIRVDKSGQQLKTVSLFLFDAQGRMVARLERALLRALAQAHRSELAGIYHLSASGAGRVDEGEALASRAERHLERVGVPGQSEGWLLLRAHMRAAVAEALRDHVGTDGVFDPAILLDGLAVEAGLRDYGAMVLDDAAQGGLLEQKGKRLALVQADDQPDAVMILGALAAEFPTAVADLALSAQAAVGIGALFAGRPVAAPRAALLQRHGAASLRLEPMVAAATALVRDLAQDGVLHVVVAEAHGAMLIPAMVDLAAAGVIRLSVAAADSVAAERFERRMPQGGTIEMIDLSSVQGVCADLILACIPGEVAAADELGDLARLLRPRGALVVMQPARDALVWFQHGPSDTARGRAGVDLATVLAGVPELAPARTFVAQDVGLSVLVAQRQPVAATALSAQVMGACADDLSRELVLAGVKAHVVTGAVDANDAVDLIWCAPGDLSDGVMALGTLLLELRASPVRPRLWVRVLDDAVGAGLRAFARVAMNEFVEMDVRLVVGGDGPQLATLIAAPGREREILLGAHGQQVARLRHGLSLTAGKDAAQAIHLHFPRPGMLENFHWLEVERPVPGPGEITVELIATGLNFRDVMLAMGLLSDDVLDEGLAGAVYGLECSGRVVALGEGVTGLTLGDLVIGFGQNSFASHATGPYQAFVPLPEGISAEAGAGLPVAFYTAWYALVELARLRAGEKVLIHGGAGGVGLAAIQIASAIGAEVIVTVSSPDKAALARLYGASHVYDSRSLDFVDQVREYHGGADVVLNSLSGEAMRGSVKCMAPRGRFIELGKRDYVANSLLALRPFRRNLTYFGVDVDQILALDPALTAVGLKAIADGFADGTYLPLPTMVFGFGQISEAFRMMQAASHVGKIVVTAPALTGVPSLKSSPFVLGGGVQLVVGGTRGFGLVTARWLAAHGARHIVVASRAGAIDPAVLSQVEALRDQGVIFEAMALDVSDGAAVRALVARVVKAYGPIAGVWHTAVNLSDGMIEGLDTPTLDSVLGPKVKGARHLHDATLDQPLKHFVMFSSASALIGNPGQGAYAAANGWLEGLARERRAADLPALAVQWGAIADVGLLANRTETLASLSRIAGVTGMQSADALARLGKVLGYGARLTDPVVTISDFAAEGALFSLPVPSSPAFAAHFAVRTSTISASGQSLAEMVEGLEEAAAHKLIVTMLAEEAAGIMRLAVSEVDLDASIDSLGMDSLMALELRMSIESKYKLELPMMAISAVGNLKELAQRIQVMLQGEGQDRASPLSDVETALISIHGGGDVAREVVTRAAVRG